MFKEMKEKQSVRFSEKELPEVKTWPVGEGYTYDLQIKVRMIGKRKPYDFEESKGLTGDFEIDSVKNITEDPKVKELKRKYL